MQMKSKMEVKLSEEELTEVLEQYIRARITKDMKIVALTHDTKSWTEGHGRSEIDYTKPDGITLVLEEQSCS